MQIAGLFLREGDEEQVAMHMDGVKTVGNESNYKM